MYLVRYACFLVVGVLSIICSRGGVAGDEVAEKEKEEEVGLVSPLSFLRQGRKDARQQQQQRLLTSREGREESLPVTEDTLEKLQNVVVLEREGIVYCPVPKVASTEWKRSLRWMAGIEDWLGEHSPVLPVVKNGLERLADRGVEETRRVLESDRYLKFVVVRDPGERMLSAFLNKCVTDGYMSGSINSTGAPSCRYLELMPELFPSMKKASLRSHLMLKQMVEGDPEDTFYHFVSGIWRKMQEAGDPCMIKNHHFKPHTCFCDMHNLLPAFDVIPFSNLSAEATALADRIPEAMSVSYAQRDESELEHVAVIDAASMTQRKSETGVTPERREEIREFLSARFEISLDNDVKVTHAAERKNTFLSERVQEVIHKIFETDYDLLGQYF